jgi:restriction system protein
LWQNSTAMPVPDFQSFMLPMLKITADGSEHPMADLRERLSREMGLSPEDLQERLPSGMQTKYQNRVAWSAVYLYRAGVLDRPRRGVFQITDRERNLLAEKLEKITIRLLCRFSEFKDFRERRPDSPDDVPLKPISPEIDTVQTPEERLEFSFQDLQNSLANEVLDAVKRASPEFFEQLVVKLLVAMGYGGSIQDAGRAVGKAGDEGVDGIIKEDKLGLDVVYIQARKWTDTVVGRPAVQAFAGSLEGHRARKGVMITTSTFSQDARDYVQRIEKKIVLLDGKELAKLMIEHNVGVTVAAVYSLKKLDHDFFDES